MVRRKHVIYQLVVRYFGNTNLTNAFAGDIATNGCGKFADINDTAIASINDFGATHIWLTGCLRQATLTGYPGLEPDDPDIVKGRAGSFYAVRDYFDVCPDYALDVANRMGEFQELVTRIHAAGLAVLIDFVPNHVARSYSSSVRPELNFQNGDDQSVFFSRENCFFYLPGQQLRLTRPPSWQPAGVVFDGRFGPEDGTPGRAAKATANATRFYTTNTPSGTDWYEAIRLNYGFNYETGEGQYDEPLRTWTIMDEVLAFWQSKGVDGFRCDMAHLVPEEAWRYLIRNARKRDPRVYFLAEAYVATSPYDPVKTVGQLLDAGFDSVYHDNSYNRLTELYRGGSQDAYNAEMLALSDRAWSTAVEYLENHDKPRLAAPVERGGFGSLSANQQLAPLQFLYSNGPVLLLNGQEVGEPGAGAEGFSGDDGRTTFFDYWCMPEFAKWVNGGRYDGPGLSAEQRSLRQYLRDVLNLCQHECVRGDGYWGLKYFNRGSQFADCSDDVYSFARFSWGKLLVVVANFRAGGPVSSAVRIPKELFDAAVLSGSSIADEGSTERALYMRMLLDADGAQTIPMPIQTAEALCQTGFIVNLRNQEAQVFEIVS